MFRLKPAFLYLILLLSIGTIFAQNLKLSNAQSTLQVYGTSSLHNWEVNADKLSGDGVFIIKSDTLVNIKILSFYVATVDLKGEKKGMKNKILNALQADKYASVRYQFEKLDAIKQVSFNNYDVDVTGNLTIAGKTKQIELFLNMSVFDNKIRIKGYKNINMIDYNIKPPRALMGILKTGDSVKVSFDALYQ